MTEVQVQRVQVGLLGTNCYIVSVPGRNDCVVIDPGANAARIHAALDGKQLAAILLTHGHFDHIGGVEKLLALDPAELVIHEADAPMLRDPDLNASWMVRARTTAPEATRLVHEGDVLEYAGLTMQVLHTPGHTPGCVCYACGEYLFTGDTVLGMGCGRTDLPGGSDEEMEQSLARLAPLRRHYTMLGGHG